MPNGTALVIVLETQKMKTTFLHTKPNKLVSIITVNYNQAQVTCELIASLSKVTYPHIEIIVVDNASHERPTIIREKHNHVQLIESKENLGFAGGNNLGLQFATGEYILFINNDVEVVPNFLEPLIDQLQSDSSIGAVSPKIKYFHTNNTIQYAGSHAVNPLTLRNGHVGCGQKDEGQFDRKQITSYAHGACMMVPSSIFNTIGKMDEQFFLYYEEQDWCERINRAGMKIYYVPESVVLHKESISTGKNSVLKTYYLTRNRILFARKNFKGSTFLLAMLYLIFISVPKNTFTYITDYKRLTAYYNALFWNLKNKTTFNY